MHSLITLEDMSTGLAVLVGSEWDNSRQLDGAASPPTNAVGRRGLVCYLVTLYQWRKQEQPLRRSWFRIYQLADTADDQCTGGYRTRVLLSLTSLKPLSVRLIILFTHAYDEKGDRSDDVRQSSWKFLRQLHLFRLSGRRMAMMLDLNGVFATFPSATFSATTAIELI